MTAGWDGLLFSLGLDIHLHFRRILRPLLLSAYLRHPPFTFDTEAQSVVFCKPFGRSTKGERCYREPEVCPCAATVLAMEPASSGRGIGRRITQLDISAERLRIKK